ncbi:Ankyrin repeat-containing protein [Musa troglodytarum]|uniref:Ankyrin repeat-containing protein n=2 Tax=Musa troglodytarum TaxID=320322 RepID=A0A9E7KSH8_9LILI|nr:Ankyrin repeat-containing protein [Musa troglodytarum]
MQVMESVPELFTPMSRELLEAARSGDTNILGTSIPDVHVTAGGNSMLHIAAKLGHTDFCNKAHDLLPSLLLLKNARGDTPLHIAARAGHHQLVNDLISTASERRAQGDDRVCSFVQMANNVGNTALHEAVQNGHEQVVVALMAKSPRVSAVTNVNGVSPLYMAVESGSTSIVRLLLAVADASCDGPNGQTALHLAVLRSYRAEITRMLLQQRGNLTRKADTTERVPLHFAAARGDHEMVRLLLENDASTAYLRDNGGATAIHVAASFGYVNVIKHLIETCPGCVEVMDGEGSNFLHVAISKGRERVVRFAAKLPRLIDLLNEPDSAGNTPLHRAIMSRDMAIIQMLSSNPSVKLSATNNRGQTPLDVALSSTRKRLVIRMFKVVIDLTNKGARFSDPQLLQDMVHPVDQNGTVEEKNHKEIADSKHAVHPVDQKGKDEEKTYQHIADSLPVVAALITTATFTAAFTLSSTFKRDRSDDGSIYMRMRRIAFVVFLIFDALAMITAICVPFLVIYVRVGTPVTQVNSLTLSEILLQVAFIGFTVAFASGVSVLLVDHWLIILIFLVILLFLPIFKRRILPFYPYLCWLTRGSEFQIIYARLMIARHRVIRIANYELAVDFIKFPGVWGFSITKF